MFLKRNVAVYDCLSIVFAISDFLMKSILIGKFYKENKGGTRSKDLFEVVNVFMNYNVIGWENMFSLCKECQINKISIWPKANNDISTRIVILVAEM